MTTSEKHIYPGVLPGYSKEGLAEGSHSVAEVRNGLLYDPELLYVECQVCGKPVLWESGRTTELLLAAGVDVSKLDERCMIVSEGCPACLPFTKDGYTLSVVRIAGLTPEEAVYMARPGGSA